MFQERSMYMMLTRSTFLPRLLASASLLGICLLAPLAMAQGSGAKTSSDIEARYKLDVERCNTGQTNQDKATCLREAGAARDESRRSEEHTYELPSLMRISYAVFCLKKKKNNIQHNTTLRTVI